MVKKLNKPTGNRVQQFIEKLKAKSENGAYGISTAADLMKNWKYIDFVDPKTDMPVLPLEWLFGARGMLPGRMMKLEAKEGVGKSNFLFLNYAMALKSANGWCYHMESEGTVPPADYIMSLGCDPDQLIVQRPGSIERCMGAVDQAMMDVREEDPEVTSPLIVGIDSVSGFGSDADMEEKVLDLTGSQGLASHARVLSRWFRDRTIEMERNQMLLIAIGQLKANIQTGPAANYGDPDNKMVTLADKPLNFHATWRVRIRTEKLVENKVDTGENVILKTEKNKLSPKYRELAVPCRRNQGFDFVEATCDFLRFRSPIVLAGDSKFSVEKAGAYVRCAALAGDKGLRKEDVAPLLYQNTDLLMSIREALRIRGYGFDFEKNYQPSAEEVADNSEPAVE